MIFYKFLLPIYINKSDCICLSHVLSLKFILPILVFFICNILVFLHQFQMNIFHLIESVLVYEIGISKFLNYSHSSRKVLNIKKILSFSFGIVWKPIHISSHLILHVFPLSLHKLIPLKYCVLFLVFPIHPTNVKHFYSPINQLLHLITYSPLSQILFCSFSSLPNIQLLCS